MVSAGVVAGNSVAREQFAVFIAGGADELGAAAFHSSIHGHQPCYTAKHVLLRANRPRGHIFS